MSGPDQELIVGLRDKDVGVLTLRGDVTSFAFLDSYLETPRRPVLGQAFEESPWRVLHQKTKLPVWFSNLLPEDRMRTIVADGLGLNSENEFDLLAALAADLPGAMTLSSGSPDGRTISSRRQDDGLRSAVEGEEPQVKFSLAGVQLKLSMVWSDNTLTMPGAGRFGDRLVKFPSARYEGVPENEYSMMSWASGVGIDTPAVALHKASELGPLPNGFDRFEESTIYAIDRFDRSDGDRIHMEDVNQVLGNWPAEKYRGAGHERLGLVIFSLCGEEDFLEFVRRLVFCIGIGNEDAHLKNWSLIYPDGVTPRLSPVYDLVSTVQYEDLDRGLALELNGSRELGSIQRADFDRLARKVGVDQQQVLDVVDDTLHRMKTWWDETSGSLPIGAGFRGRLRDHHASVPLLAPLT